MDLAHQRAQGLLGVAHALRDPHRSELFAALESLDTGRPIAETLGDVDSAAEAFEWMAGQAFAMSGQHMQMTGQDTATVLREPLGVCVGIGAW